jgi:hypothetical protein
VIETDLLRIQFRRREERKIRQTAATGAGSAGRNMLGIVIFSGVSLATLLTLFIVPAFYKLLARNSGSPRTIARRLETLTSRSNDARKDASFSR